MTSFRSSSSRRRSKRPQQLNFHACSSPSGQYTHAYTSGDDIKVRSESGERKSPDSVDRKFMPRFQRCDLHNFVRPGC